MSLLPQAVTSVLVMLFYLLSWFIPCVVSFYYNEMAVFKVFLGVGSIAACILGAIFYRLRSIDESADGFLVIVLSWLGICVISSIPFYALLPITYIDAWTEAASGLTTTGIEFLGDIQSWPHSLLWYRQQLEWVGGVGIIIMTIALVSLQEGTLLSVYNSEFGRGVRDIRITPRLASTAKYVISIYGLFLTLCTLGHWSQGVPFYYAILESMATVSTGGYTLSGLYPFYETAFSQMTAIVFMLLGAVGFHTHYAVLSRKQIGAYWQHAEARMYLLITAIVCLIMATIQADTPIVRLIFDVVAFISTTGFETQIHNSSALIAILFVIMGLVGGCAGSTAGGLKMIRLRVIWEESRSFLLRLIHPKIIRPISVGGKVLDVKYLTSIRGYIGLFVLSFVLLLLMLIGLGVPLNNATLLLCATITNVGGSVGDLGIELLTNYQKFALSMVMLLGRVEIAAFLVVLMPHYWQQR